MSKPKTQSNIGGIVGSAGGGKSLFLAISLLWGIMEGEKTWCNMPVKTGKVILARRYSPSGRKLDYAEAAPIDWDLLYRLDESMLWGRVGIDEIGYFAGALEHMTIKNRLINSCIRQARHRSLSFYYTTKSFHRVDPYLREETDWVALCTDLSFSPWGRANHLEGGEVVNIKFFDISGRMTGKSIYNTSHAKDWERSGWGSYKELNLHGRPWFDCYETDHVIPIEEAFTGVSLKFQKRVIGNQEEVQEDTRRTLLQGISDFVKGGHIEIPTQQYWEYMRNVYKLNGSPNFYGRFLPSSILRRWTRQGNMYNFEQVEVLS